MRPIFENLFIILSIFDFPNVVKNCPMRLLKDQVRQITPVLYGAPSVNGSEKVISSHEIEN